MKTLLINAHPDYQNNNHYSIKLQEIFLKKYKEKFPEEDLDILTLYETEIPRIENGALFSIWNKQAAGEILSPEEARIKNISDGLLQDFKNHHRIVIAMPVHNFNVTSKLKDYLDNILIARETFTYTKEGSVGLMTDDYKVLALVASGSIYTNDDRYTALDFANHYLDGVFREIMGFESYKIIRAQGTSLSSADEVAILNEAEKEIEEYLPLFYGMDK